MNAPEIKTAETVASLPRGENNPRNSEGDFARLKNGDILFAYSRYTGSDADDDAPCDIAALISKDGGRTFSHLPNLLAAAAEHSTRNIMSVTLRRLKDGTLCLFYLCKKGPYSEMYLKRACNDDETRFGEPECVIPKKRDTYYVVNNCRVLVREDGTLLIPAARHRIIKDNDGHRYGGSFAFARFFEGDVNAGNWYEKSDVRLVCPGHSSTGLQEPGLTELPDGRLYAYFRTDLMSQYESYSSDGGKSWTPPVASRFTSPASPMLIIKNPYSGIYYAIWNPVPNYNGRKKRGQSWGRTPLVLAQSENGTDFGEYTVIADDENCGYCYPAVYFLGEKEMLLSYCCGGPEDGICLTKTVIEKIILK